MGESVFDVCKNATKLVLSNQITKVPFETFFNCKSFSEINIPSSLTVIPYEMFMVVLP